MIYVKDADFLMLFLVLSCHETAILYLYRDYGDNTGFMYCDNRFNTIINKTDVRIPISLNTI